MSRFFLGLHVEVTPMRIAVTMWSALWCGVAITAMPIAGSSPAGGEPHSRDTLMIPPARNVTFEVTEGTAMNLDVSPDGQTIVFDLLGDIYTVPVGGGTASRLTSGMAFDGHPVFSPDGQRIAFVSDR